MNIPKDPNKSATGLTLTGKINEHGGKNKDAISKMQDASLSAAPSQNQINRLLSHYQAGRLGEAGALATSLTQQFPKHPFGWKVLGAVLQRTGRLTESLMAKRRAIELSPQDPDAHHNLSTSLRELGRLNEAEQSCRRAIELKPDHAEAYSNLGATLQELGRVDEAIAIYQEAIGLLPNSFKASNNLGVTLAQLGRLDEAEASYRQAISIRPDAAEAHNNLGITLKELGKLDEAEASYQLAITLKPDYAEAHSNLGNALKALGRLSEAEESCRRAITIKPHYAKAHSNLGNTLRALGRLDEAEVSCRRAMALEPDSTEVQNSLGVTLKELGRLDEAEASYRQAIFLKPDYAEAHSNLGNTLKELGRLDEAETSYKQAIALKPDYAEAHNNLGNTLQEVGRFDEARARYEKAIALEPCYAEAFSNLGNTLKELGRLDEAEVRYKQAIALKPDFAEAHNNLSVTLLESGRFDEAEVSCRQAIKLNPDFVKAHSNLLFLIGSMQFDVCHYKATSKCYAQCVHKAVTSRFKDFPCVKNADRLRVGFVSGDFKSHPVGFFLEGLLTQLQSSSMDLFAYPTINTDDEVTGRLRACFHEWNPLVGLSDMDAARKIHSDGVHILIDLSGHTAKNRLPVFARKPAPVQVTWLGYFASTGLPEMDFILGDPYVTPHAEAAHFTEKIWQLPESYLCFSPPEFDSKVAPLPAYSNGFITFGCFNSLSRMTDEVVATRAAILHAVPESKLYLKDKQLDHKLGRDRVFSRFAAVDVAAERLILEGRSSREEYLECYSRVDIALSPFPYGGGTTSAEGLWMGVPVITNKGSHFLSRLGESIAHNSGLADWIASDKEEYVAKAVAHASNVDALSELRAGMRDRILDTPLFNVPRFAAHFEQAIKAMWNRIG